MTDFEEDIRSCINALNNGGVILYPTDTIWGLGCDALNEAAIEQIFTIKQRPKHKAMIVLLAEAKDILQYVAAPHPDIIDITESFDRPTTVIYNNALGFPENLLNEDGSIGIRVTTDPFCKALIKRLKKPLVSTSANISGRPSPQHFKEIDTDIIEAVDYTVKYRRDDTTPKLPSRIVRFTDNDEMEIIRE